jgi:hypothetical protein
VFRRFSFSPTTFVKPLLTLTILFFCDFDLFKKKPFLTARLPHAFYPVQTDGYVEIGPGDKLAARCIMVNDQNRTVTTGPRDSDEMCIFYVMYYIETEKEPQLSQVRILSLLVNILQ